MDEYLRNKFRINLVSLAGPGHEREIKFLKRVITYNTDGWTWTGDPTHSKTLVNEINFGEPREQSRVVPKSERSTQ